MRHTHTHTHTHYCWATEVDAFCACFFVFLFFSLKSQQGLLVDFSAFPQKFIDLLQLCLSEAGKDSPKYVCGGVDNYT